MLMTSKAAGIVEIATVLSVPIVLIGASGCFSAKTPACSSS